MHRIIINIIDASFNLLYPSKKPKIIHWILIIAMELHISEHDEAGRDVAAYVSSKSSDRIEFIVCLIESLPSIGRGQ